MNPRSSRGDPSQVAAVLASLGLVVLCAFANGGLAHAGKVERAAKCATKGDAKVSKSIAKKMVKHAIKKYEIADLVDDQTTKGAKKEVYAFLKWKLGNPSAICAQYVTAGQKHFNKAYGDEAAAALLGFNLPNEKAGRATFQLPPELVDFWMMTEKLQNAGKAYVLQYYYRIPAFLTKRILDEQTELTGKVLKKVGFNIPKKYDFPNETVLVAIEAKRNPEQARAKFQKVVDEAAKQEGPSAKSPSAVSEEESEEEEDMEEEGSEGTKKTKKAKKKKN
jgi:hypothetical protein